MVLIAWLAGPTDTQSGTYRATYAAGAPAIWSYTPSSALTIPDITISDVAIGGDSRRATGFTDLPVGWSYKFKHAAVKLTVTPGDGVYSGSIVAYGEEVGYNSGKAYFAWDGPPAGEADYTGTLHYAEIAIGVSSTYALGTNQNTNKRDWIGTPNPPWHTWTDEPIAPDTPAGSPVVEVGSIGYLFEGPYYRYWNPTTDATERICVASGVYDAGHPMPGDVLSVVGRVVQDTTNTGSYADVPWQVDVWTWVEVWGPDGAVWPPDTGTPLSVFGLSADRTPFGLSRVVYNDAFSSTAIKLRRYFDMEATASEVALSLTGQSPDIVCLSDGTHLVFRSDGTNIQLSRIDDEGTVLETMASPGSGQLVSGHIDPMGTCLWEAHCTANTGTGDIVVRRNFDVMGLGATWETITSGLPTGVPAQVPSLTGDAGELNLFYHDGAGAVQALRSIDCGATWA